MPEDASEQRDTVLLTPSQRDQAAEMLTSAFQNDPMYAIILPDAILRARPLRSLWRAVIRCCLLYGEVYSTPDVRGVACWLPPGSTNISLWRSLRAGLPQATMRFPGESRRRLMDLVGYTEDLHRRLMSTSHWYLMALGVDPLHQRQGIAGRLLQPVMERSGADGTPCYLETQTESNVAFYQRRGFDVVHEGDVPGYPVRIWVMVRQPHPS